MWTATFSNPTMAKPTAFKERIKTMLVANPLLQLTATDIADELPLVGLCCLGLASVDALQLVVALDKNFRLNIPDQAVAKEILQNVGTIVKAVQNRIAAGEA